MVWEESKKKSTISRTIRCLRKMMGLKQSELAQLCSCTQGYVSKIERGDVEPNASFIIDLGSSSGVDLLSFKLGFIDSSACVEIEDVDRVGLFRIPKRYGTDTSMKIKGLFPLINYCKHLVGEANFNDYLKRYVKIDPDYFYCYNHQVNFRFVMKLVEFIQEKTQLNSLRSSEIFSSLSTVNAHGRDLFSLYKMEKSPIGLIETFINQQNKYSLDFEYSIEEKSTTGLSISVKKASHVKDVLTQKEYDMLDVFDSEYHKGHLQGILSLGSFESTLITSTSGKRSGDHCILKVRQM